MRRGRVQRRRPFIISAAALAALAAAPTDAQAAIRYWVDAIIGGNWGNPSSWAAFPGGPGGAGVPVAGDSAVIEQNDGFNRTATLNTTANVVILNLTNRGGGTNTVSHTAAVDLTTTQGQYIGYSANGRGTYTHSNGINTVGTELQIGYDAGSIGTYNLSGTATLRAPSQTHGIFVGRYGTGTFNQSGGAVVVGSAANAGQLFVGYNSGSNGTYNLSGGTLTAHLNGIYVGLNFDATGTATGLFAQTGGTVTTLQLFLGNRNGSNGTYTLGGGTLTSGHAYVGYQVSPTAGSTSTGTFTQSAGTHTVTEALRIGSNDNNAGTATGTYNLSGTGIVNSNEVRLGTGFGTSAAANGSFNQTGGTHAVTNSMYIGDDQGKTGAYTLGGTGTLTVGDDVHLGYSGFGSFNQTGGTVTVNGQLQYASTALSTGGAYTLSGGSLTTQLGMGIFKGTFDHTGGTHTTGQPGFLNGASVSGTYNLSGTGNLIGRGFIVVDGDGLGPTTAGALVQTGGTLTIAAPGGDGLLVLAQNTGRTGTYTLSGSGTATVNGDLQVGGIQILNVVQPGGTGILNVAGGTLNVTSTLRVFPTLGTTVNLSSGTLNVGSLAGEGGLLNWTGGTLNVTGAAGALLAPSEFLQNVTLTAGKSFAATSITINSGASLTLNGGNFTYATTLNLAGGVVNGSAALNNSKQINGFGQIAGTGTFSNSGAVNVTSGALLISRSGALANLGNITLAAGTQLQLSGGNLANTGVIQLVPGAGIVGTATINNNAGGVIAGAGSIATPLTNQAGGTLLVQTGTLTVGSALGNGGTIQLAGPGATLSGGAINNTGVVRGDGVVNNALTNAAAGEIRAEAGKWLTIASMPSANLGRVNLLDGTVEFNTGLTNAATGLITGRGTLRANAGLANNGQVQLLSGVSGVHGNVTGGSGSKIILSGGANATFYNAVTMTPGSEFRVSAGSIAAFLGNVTGVGAFSGSGLKVFEAGVADLGPLATGGDTAVATGAVVNAAHFRENALTVGGLARVAANGTTAGTSRVNDLAVIDGGRLDLTNNKLIVAAGDLGTFTGGAYTGVTGLVDAGRGNTGNALWNGSGVVTTDTRAINTNDLTSLGVAAAGQLARITFGGLSVAAADVLVMFTYGGDANLDGKINIDDYGQIDSNVSKSGTVFGWNKGDFNYDGKINIDDYGIIDGNIGRQGTPFTTSGIAAPALDGIAAVPEPAGIALVAAVLPLLRRRVRRAQ